MPGNREQHAGESRPAPAGPATDASSDRDTAERDQKQRESNQGNRRNPEEHTDDEYDLFHLAPPLATRPYGMLPGTGIVDSTYMGQTARPTRT